MYFNIESKIFIMNWYQIINNVRERQNLQRMGMQSYETMYWGAKDKSRSKMSFSSLQLPNIASLSYRNKFLKNYDKKKQLEKLKSNL